MSASFRRRRCRAAARRRLRARHQQEERQHGDRGAGQAEVAAQQDESQGRGRAGGVEAPAPPHRQQRAGQRPRDPGDTPDRDQNGLPASQPRLRRRRCTPGWPTGDRADPTPERRPATTSRPLRPGDRRGAQTGRRPSRPAGQPADRRPDGGSRAAWPRPRSTHLAAGAPRQKSSTASAMNANSGQSRSMSSFGPMPGQTTDRNGRSPAGHSSRFVGTGAEASLMLIELVLFKNVRGQLTFATRSTNQAVGRFSVQEP